MQKLLHTCMFVAFFTAGAAALGLSVLVDDLLHYYHNKQLLEKAQQDLNKLENLNADYDALLARLHNDPNIVYRLAPATLGVEPEPNENVVYPRVRAEELAAARKALTEQADQQTRCALPQWLERCARPPRRLALFIAGASLVLLSFVFFGPADATQVNDSPSAQPQ